MTDDGNDDNNVTPLGLDTDGRVSNRAYTSFSLPDGTQGWGRTEFVTSFAKNGIPPLKWQDTVIGQGQYGAVYSALAGKTALAVKCERRLGKTLLHESLCSFVREVDALRAMIGSSNAVQLYAAWIRIEEDVDWECRSQACYGECSCERSNEYSTHPRVLPYDIYTGKTESKQECRRRRSAPQPRFDSSKPRRLYARTFIAMEHAGQSLGTAVPKVARSLTMMMEKLNDAAEEAKIHRLETLGYGIRRILAGILSGMVALEGHGLVHRDLKPDNVMVSDQGEIRIGDFGMAKSARDDVKTCIVTTLPYRAPELLVKGDVAKSSRYGNEVDSWSFGIIGLEIIARICSCFNETHGEGSVRSHMPIFQARSSLEIIDALAAMGIVELERSCESERLAHDGSSVDESNDGCTEYDDRDDDDNDNDDDNDANDDSDDDDGDNDDDDEPQYHGEIYASKHNQKCESELKAANNLKRKRDNEDEDKDEKSNRETGGENGSSETGIFGCGSSQTSERATPISSVSSLSSSPLTTASPLSSSLSSSSSSASASLSSSFFSSSPLPFLTPLSSPASSMLVSSSGSVPSSSSSSLFLLSLTLPPFNNKKEKQSAPKTSTTASLMTPITTVISPIPTPNSQSRSPLPSTPLPSISTPTSTIMTAARGNVVTSAFSDTAATTSAATITPVTATRVDRPNRRALLETLVLSCLESSEEVCKTEPRQVHAETSRLIPKLVLTETHEMVVKRITDWVIKTIGLLTKSARDLPKIWTALIESLARSLHPNPARRWKPSALCDGPAFETTEAHEAALAAQRAATRPDLRYLPKIKQDTSALIEHMLDLRYITVDTCNHAKNLARAARAHDPWLHRRWGAPINRGYAEICDSLDAAASIVISSILGEVDHIMPEEIGQVASLDTFRIAQRALTLFFDDTAYAPPPTRSVYPSFHVSSDAVPTPPNSIEKPPFLSSSSSLLPPLSSSYSASPSRASTRKEKSQSQHEPPPSPCIDMTPEWLSACSDSPVGESSFRYENDKTSEFSHPLARLECSPIASAIENNDPPRLSLLNGITRDADTVITDDPDTETRDRIHERTLFSNQRREQERPYYYHRHHRYYKSHKHGVCEKQWGKEAEAEAKAKAPGEMIAESKNPVLSKTTEMTEATTTTMAPMTISATPLSSSLSLSPPLLLPSSQSFLLPPLHASSLPLLPTQLPKFKHSQVDANIKVETITASPAIPATENGANQQKQQQQQQKCSQREQPKSWWQQQRQQQHQNLHHQRPQLQSQAQRQQECHRDDTSTTHVQEALLKRKRDTDRSLPHKKRFFINPQFKITVHDAHSSVPDPPLSTSTLSTVFPTENGANLPSSRLIPLLPLTKPLPVAVPLFTKVASISPAELLTGALPISSAPCPIMPASNQAQARTQTIAPISRPPSSQSTFISTSTSMSIAPLKPTNRLPNHECHRIRCNASAHLQSFCNDSGILFCAFASTSPPMNMIVPTSSPITHICGCSACTDDSMAPTQLPPTIPDGLPSDDFSLKLENDDNGFSLAFLQENSCFQDHHHNQHSSFPNVLSHQVVKTKKTRTSTRRQCQPQ